MGKGNRFYGPDADDEAAKWWPTTTKECDWVGARAASEAAYREAIALGKTPAEARAAAHAAHAAHLGARSMP